MEGDWEEQEHLVVAELSGIINSDFLSTVQGACKMVAVDSAHPVMQVGRYVFAGEYEDALGTCVILEESERASADGSPKLRYRCHTMKKLMLQRTFLTDRKDGEPGSGCIETLALDDGDKGGRNSSICSFLQGDEERAPGAGSSESECGEPDSGVSGDTELHG